MPRKKMGMLDAVWTRATMRDDGSRLVISHAAPVLCIQVPIFETACAIQRPRKNGFCSGDQSDSAAGRGSVISAVVLLLDVCEIVRSDDRASRPGRNWRVP
jgi:hypothetical protein